MEAASFNNFNYLTNVGGKLSCSVNILLITHSGIGWELIQAAKNTFGMLPLPVTNLAITNQEDPEALVTKAKSLIDEIDHSAGTLILTDMFGTTPFHIARKLTTLGAYKIKVISGLNLPMLIRVLNYPELSLEKLAMKAISGGRDGVLEAGILN